MSYTKQTWQAGDEITSAKLNHLEDGINNVATEVANFPVEVNNPQDGDTLIYNAAEQKWISGSNNDGSGGGGNLVVHITDLTNNSNIEKTLDKTFKEIYDVFMAGGNVVSIVTSVDDEGTIYSRTPISVVMSGEFEGNSIYGITFEGKPDEVYTANNENDYPRYVTLK